jgi:hypothetical protein
MIPQVAPRSQGRAAFDHRSVVGKRFRKTHADAGTDRGRETDEEGLPILMGGEGGREQGRQCRDRAVHQTGEARLDVLQNEHAFARAVLFGAHVRN